MSGLYSEGPDGVRWSIPSAGEMEVRWREISAAAAGRRVVVVQGLGFVGAAVATAIAAARNAEGRPLYFVIGVDLATPSAWWKIASLQTGSSPFATSDPEFARLLHEAVVVEKNLVATSSEEAYGLADVILVDVQLDVVSDLSGAEGDIRVGLENYEKALRCIGRGMKSGALVIVETTVPIGMSRKVVRPILEQERAARGIASGLLLAHAYERVMPGRRYLDSIRKFWRAFAADDDESGGAARDFLESFTDTASFPVSRLEGTTASEMAKLLENSYRAANIAFIHEWTLLAEHSGVNLWEVVDAIRVRKGTHDNMRYPGFGVGGYCLTKDSYLAQWGAKHLLGLDCGLPVTLAALSTNYAMPLHTRDLVRECAGGSLAGLRILLCGVSYLADVADTRNSPSLPFADAVIGEGAWLSYHDSLVGVWPERPEISRVSGLDELAKFDAVVFAVPHAEYRPLRAEDFPPGMIVVDASNIVDDPLAEALRARGCQIAGAGKGHWREKGWHLNS